MPVVQNKIPSVGQRVRAVCGPSQSEDGVVTEVVTNRWGTHAVVLFDDGTTDTCHGLRAEPGIGWFLIEGV